MKSWNRQNLALMATFTVGILLFAMASARYTGFASSSVFVNLLDDNAFLGITAVGMTFVILSGGIDLSVGAMIGLTSILMAILVERYQIHPGLAIPAILLLGGVFGAIQGILIAFFDLAPFLVTLAGMFFARGLAFTFSLDSIPLTHSFFSNISQVRLPLASAQVPPMALLFLLTVLGAFLVLGWTRFGRAVYALGGNALSARLMGIPIAGTQVRIYVASGFLSALGGIAYTIYTSSGNATAGTGLELDAIAAVVIGGTLLTGGTGNILGTLAGTVILGMIQTIITFEATLSSWWTRIVIGVLVFVFVLLQRLLGAMGRSRPGGGSKAPVLQIRWPRVKKTGTSQA